LGPENFGLVNFAIAFVTYFGIISDYGFNLTATREISINRNDTKAVSKIFSTVISIKVLFLTVSFIILLALCWIITEFRELNTLYIIAFLMVAGQAIFPNWFFQGIEKMKYITILNIGIKSISVIFIFLLVTSSTDYLILISIYAGTTITIGILSLIVIFGKFKVRYNIPSFLDIYHQLKEGSHVFASTLSISLYTNSNAFILGLLAGNTAVGYFVAADKIRMAFQGIFSQVGQSVFPHMSQLYFEKIERGVDLSKKLIKYGGSVVFISCVGLLIFSNEIIYFVVGDQYANSVIVLRVISFLPFLIFLSNIAGIQTMLNIGMQKQFFYIIILAGIINIILLFSLVPFFFELGTAVSVVVAELIVTIGMIVYLQKRKINLFNGYSKLQELK